MDHAVKLLQAEPASRADRTRLKIMRVAERLFGAHGLNGPSLRQIALEAEQSNASVINYHFNDKDNLIREIMIARIIQMEPMRGRMLEIAEERCLLGDVETLLRVLCLPHLELRDPDGRCPYSEFLLEFMVRYRGPNSAPHPFDEDQSICPHLSRTLDLLRRRMYYLDAAAVERRNVNAVVIFLVTLISATEHKVDDAELMRRVKDALIMGAYALTAPLAPPDDAESRLVHQPAAEAKSV
jgi:AcrR family transcriptional regulator